MPAAVWLLAGLAVVTIWVCVEVASVYAPDFVSGSQHEHLPLVAWTDWIWGFVAISSVVLTTLEGVRSRVLDLVPCIGLAIGVAAVWILVALVSGFSPVFVTGTDPTLIPLAALGISIVGAFLTGLVCAFVKVLSEQCET